MGLFIKNKRRGRKIINHHIVEGTRESHPRVHDLQHPRLGKPRRGLQIMDTRMGFPCPFNSVVIDSISFTHGGDGIQNPETPPKIRRLDIYANTVITYLNDRACTQFNSADLWS